MAFKEKYFSQFEAAFIEEIEQSGKVRKFKASEILMGYGKYIRSIPLLISGVIKIMRENEDGEELLLYFIEEGDTCAMTLTCCLGKTKSEIRAIAETEVEVMMVPVEKMDEWMQKFKSWRTFILNSYHTRMNEMLGTIDLLAFNRMDQRILTYLKAKCQQLDTNIIEKTHQDIAHDLHTSRVVVSRLLKRLEKEGLIRLHRFRVELL